MTAERGSSYLSRVAGRGQAPMLVPPRRPGRLWSDPQGAVADGGDEVRRAVVPRAIAAPAPVETQIAPAPQSLVPARPALSTAPGAAPLPREPVAAWQPDTVRTAAPASVPRASGMGAGVEGQAVWGRAAAATRSEEPLAPLGGTPAPGAPDAPLGSPELSAAHPHSIERAAQRPELSSSPPLPIAAQIAVGGAPPVERTAAAPAVPAASAARARRAPVSLGEALTAAFSWAAQPDDAAPATREPAAPPAQPILQIGTIEVEVVPPAAQAPKPIPSERLARGYSHLGRRG